MSSPLYFAVKVKLLRQSQDLTMLEAEKKCGLREGRWEKIEAGDHEIRAGDFVRILRGLGVSVKAFEAKDFEEVAP